MKKEISLTNITKQLRLSDLTLDDKLAILVGLSSEILKICEIHRYSPEPSILEDASRTIASSNKYFSYQKVCDSIRAYKSLQVDFFTLAGLIAFVNQDVQRKAQQELEAKKKKDQEDYYKRLEALPQLTPEQEAERRKQYEDFRNQLLQNTKAE